jgi:nitrate reductase gamma subunit
MEIPPRTQKTYTPPSPEELAARAEQDKQMKRMMTGVIIGAVIILAFLIAMIYLLVRPATPVEVVSRIRDVFIIVVALETLVIGVALIVLIMQLASLINLLQNEVRPILHATSETVNTLRGTAEFLGESVVEPVIKLNGYLAGMQRMLELMGIRRK